MNDKHNSIQSKIIKKMRKIQKLHTQIYWLAKERDNLKIKLKNNKPKSCK